MVNNTDVELEALLNEDKGSGEVVTPVASDENNKTVTPDLKADEIAQASARANERIRELVEQNKATEEQLTKLKESFNTKNSTELDTFINSIEDEPSRNLLKTFGNLMRQDVRKEYNPVLEEYNSSRFEKEFAEYGAKVPELAAHKEEIKKNYLRNPSQPLKALVSETLLDITASKIKPVESAPSVASRSKPELADASTEDLYAILESRPPIN